MAPSGAKRRLTTILAADVEGYSRLMRADEEATLATLKTYREIIDGLIARHDGRIFGTGGDSVLAEFGSAVEAVRAAISIQEELRVRNAELAETRRMHFRIGITVGDVMVEGDNLFGDGVNVAARLEGLAEAGGICISGSAFEQVKNKLTIGFEDIGPQEVKNIDEPVSAFRLIPGADATPAKTPTSARKWRVPAIAAAAAVVLIAGGGYWAWDNWWRFQSVEAASVERMAYPLPDKPSIAVLPFVNLSGDPADQFLPDGISEDITAALSKLSEFFVISRTTTATYKDRDVTVKQVAEELGVRYVLEGSVQRQGERMRVTAQLIDALSGDHVWADRYDRDITDLFAGQGRNNAQCHLQRRRRARSGRKRPKCPQRNQQSRSMAACSRRPRIDVALHAGRQPLGEGSIRARHCDRSRLPLGLFLAGQQLSSGGPKRLDRRTRGDVRQGP